MNEHLILLSRKVGFQSRVVGATPYNYAGEEKEFLRHLLWMCELQNWLGEKHNTVCLPIYNETYNYWEYYVNQILSESPSIQKSAFSSYEEALEEGLLYSLKLLIK